MSGWRRVLALSLCTLAPVAGCGGGRPVTVGVVVPLTGPSAVCGEPVARAIEIAHRQLAADPELRRPIALEIRDSESDPGRPPSGCGSSTGRAP